MTKLTKILILTSTIFYYCTFSIFCQVTDSSRLWYDTLTFKERLDLVTPIQSQGFKINFENIDTLKKTVDIRLNFHFLKKSINLILKNIISKDSTKDITIQPRQKNKNENNTTILLSNVKLFWVSSTFSYFSTDSSTLLTLNGIKFDKPLNTIIEIKPFKSSIELNLYIEITSNNWYYFNYKNSILQTISSITDFNTDIKNERVCKRIIKGRKGLSDYQYTLSTEQKQKSLMKRHESILIYINNRP